MKLLTERGELALPADFTFTVEQNSPLFSGDGAGSIPATIPSTPENLRVLGFPDRLGSRTRFVRKVAAKLAAGTLHKDGTLVVDSVRRRGELTVALALEESDMYARLCGRNIREMFADAWYFDHTGGSTPAALVAADLNDIYMGRTTSLVFALFPVAVTGTDGYLVMNAPQGGDGMPPLTWQSREIREGDTPVCVPDGYGMMPFLYLGTLLNMIFHEGGYTVTANPFRTDPALSKVVVLHNTADCCCPGKVCVADLVPDITVSELLEALENRFHAYVRVKPERKQVDIVMMEDALASPVDLNLTPKMDGTPTVEYADPSHVALKPDTSVEGGEPAAETIEDLHRRYPIITFIEGIHPEIRTGRRSGGGGQTAGPDVLCVKATGAIYERRYDLEGTAEYCLVGTVNMPYDKKMNDTAEEIAAKDVSPAMVQAAGGFNMTMPYIGPRIHRNTSYRNDIDRSAGQKLMLCFAPGVSVGGRYRYGTTLRWNDYGSGAWNTWGLVYDDMYGPFFRRYNEMVMNDAMKVRARICLDEAALQGLDVFAMKELESQRMLIEKLTYTVGARVKAGECILRPVIGYEDQVTDPAAPTFEAQRYFWRMNTSQADAAATSHNQEYVGAWKYKDPSDGEKHYLGPPAAAGLRADERQVTILVAWKRAGSQADWDWSAASEQVVTVWEESYEP